MDKERQEKVIELFNKGMAAKDIAIMFGVSRTTVENMLAYGRAERTVINKNVDKDKVKALYDARIRNDYWSDLDHIAQECMCTIEQVKEVLSMYGDWQNLQSRRVRNRNGKVT